MQNDLVAISKRIDAKLYGLVGELEKLDSDFGWIRDSLLDNWILKNGMMSFYKDNQILRGSFISDRLSNIFFESETEQEANDKLNLLMFELLEAGFEL